MNTYAHIRVWGSLEAYWENINFSVRQLRKFQEAMAGLSLWSWELVKAVEMLWEQELIEEFLLWQDGLQKEGGLSRIALLSLLPSLHDKKWMWEQKKHLTSTIYWSILVCGNEHLLCVGLCVYKDKYALHVYTDRHHMSSEEALQATQALTTWRSTETKGICTPSRCSACVWVSPACWPSLSRWCYC